MKSSPLQSLATCREIMGDMLATDVLGRFDARFDALFAPLFDALPDRGPFDLATRQSADNA